MGNKSAVKKRKVKKAPKTPKMAVKRKLIEISDSSPSPFQKGTPLRSIFCLKNKEEIKKFEEQEECFILEFDPYNNLDALEFPSTIGNDDNAEEELSFVTEKGQVACRDYPHPRNTCARFPFKKTPHDKHCKLCYCYVCDVSAPCTRWTGAAGHCHALKDEVWDHEKWLRRLNKNV
ncbi:uncharacterized protein LOC121756026 [Salvia splendens]|uniref:uncharacterized protein LOC121756026 n=1 Tax=Salvia splendens TaxID=180675 RepID=UPI001C27E2C1|nr:uncharacterized protein LOC121756026 [Salvia splendens]